MAPLWDPFLSFRGEVGLKAESRGFFVAAAWFFERIEVRVAEVWVVGA
jgi:hypothetical protein